MPIQHHPLVEEFAEYRETIHELKLKDAHFRKMAHEYEGLDKSIFRAEQGIEIVNDDYLDLIKKERLLLKDKIFRILRS